MKYHIFQLYCLEKTSYGFMSWDFAQKHRFDFRDYVGVYMGEVDQNDAYVALEVLFTQFNVHRPEDFKGHSLSMSDIVKLEDPFGNEQYYYCDRMGWENITSFVAEKKTVKKADLHTRAEMVRAMDLIARCINDEETFMSWLSDGVADEDIKPDTTDEDLEYYCETGVFADLMKQFLELMSLANEDGGLYCDEIVSA